MKPASPFGLFQNGYRVHPSPLPPGPPSGTTPSEQATIAPKAPRTPRDTHSPWRDTRERQTPRPQLPPRTRPPSGGFLLGGPRGTHGDHPGGGSLHPAAGTPAPAPRSLRGPGPSAPSGLRGRRVLVLPPHGAAGEALPGGQPPLRSPAVRSGAEALPQGPEGAAGTEGHPLPDRRLPGKPGASRRGPGRLRLPPGEPAPGRRGVDPDGTHPPVSGAAGKRPGPPGEGGPAGPEEPRHREAVGL